MREGKRAISGKTFEAMKENDETRGEKIERGQHIGGDDNERSRPTGGQDKKGRIEAARARGPASKKTSGRKREKAVKWRDGGEMATR